MARTRKTIMHLQSFIFILLVWSIVAESCDKDTQYIKDDKCCKLCEPGTRMVQSPNCEDPDCRDCLEGEYQDQYNKLSRCKRQPSCDPNLNLITQAQSKTELTPCVCMPGYHCADPQCASCVKNKECQPGEKISKNGIQTADTVCEVCPIGTFSDNKSALTCKPWTICLSGQVSPGSSTADRICKERSKTFAVVTTVVLVLLMLLVLLLISLYYLYKKGKTGSISFMQKFRTCRFWGNTNTHQPVQGNGYIENGEPQQPVNQPQEDTDEDLVKLDVPLSPGLSENGMPVSQDHSKSLILSETETEPARFSDHF